MRWCNKLARTCGRGMEEGQVAALPTGYGQGPQTRGQELWRTSLRNYMLFLKTIIKLKKKKAKSGPSPLYIPRHHHHGVGPNVWSFLSLSLSLAGKYCHVPLHGFVLFKSVPTLIKWKSNHPIRSCISYFCPSLLIACPTGKYIIEYVLNFDWTPRAY